MEQLWDHNAGLSAAQDTPAGVQHFMRNTIRFKSLETVGCLATQGASNACSPAAGVHATCDAHACTAIHRRAFLRLLAAWLLCISAHRRNRFHPSCSVHNRRQRSFGFVSWPVQVRQQKRRRGVFSCGPSGHLCSAEHFLNHRHPQELVCGAEEHTWRRKHDRYLHNLGLSHLHLRLYSLRRRGATNALRRGQTMAQICTRGSWANEKTARMYIQEAVILLQKQPVTPLTHAFLVSLADAWCFNCLR